MSKEQVEEMIESGKRHEDMRRHEASQTSEMIEIGIVRNKILQEILNEIKRLRLTGLQP
jgi:ribosomal protein S25